MTNDHAVNAPPPFFAEAAHADPDLHGLLAAVCAAPDDDTPRLVYADRLDELALPGYATRAEFIRTQVTVLPRWGAGPPVGNTAATPSEPALTDGSELTAVGLPAHPYAAWARALDLLKAPSAADPRVGNYAGWAEPWRRDCAVGHAGVRERPRVAHPLSVLYATADDIPVPAPEPPWTYRRGFVEDLVMRPEDWLRLGDSVSWPRPCAACRGTGRTRHHAFRPDDTRHREWTEACDGCPGSGRPPCPVTAAPVRRVVLTAPPTLGLHVPPLPPPGHDPRLGPLQITDRPSWAGRVFLPGRTRRRWDEVGGSPRPGGEVYTIARLLGLEWPAVREWVIDGRSYSGSSTRTLGG